MVFFFKKTLHFFFIYFCWKGKYTETKRYREKELLSAMAGGWLTFCPLCVSMSFLNTDLPAYYFVRMMTKLKFFISCLERIISWEVKTATGEITSIHRFSPQNTWNRWSWVKGKARTWTSKMGLPLGWQECTHWRHLCSLRRVRKTLGTEARANGWTHTAW